jgi:hypothetical protein
MLDQLLIEEVTRQWFVSDSPGSQRLRAGICMTKAGKENFVLTGFSLGIYCL